MTPVGIFQTLLLLLTAAVLLALLARRIRVPPAAAYVVGGMIIAVIPRLPAIELDPALVMVLFLPPLLQASAFFTVWRDFRANLRPILLLAVGCVAFTTLVVGWVTHHVAPGLPWAVCFALGAIVSPPDAVAAGAVLERLPIPRRLRVVLEGESLVNDASGLVLFRFAVVAAMTGTFHAGEAAATFVGLAAGGVAVGLACGFAFIRLFSRLADVNLEIAASFLVAWASYLAAEAIGASGVLAVVACGLNMGWHQHATFSPETRLRARAAWGFVVFVLEALVFILIGLSLHAVLGRLGDGSAGRVLITAVAVSATVIVARFAWVFPATYLPRWLIPGLARRDPVPSIGFPIVVGWAGMRGVVSLAAALALPQDLPGRDLVIGVTFAVILVTVLVQGTTLEWVIRRVGVIETRPETDPDEVRGRALLAAATHDFMRTRSDDPVDGAIARDLVDEYADLAEATARTHRGGAAVLAGRRARLGLRLEAADHGRRELLRLHKIGELHEEVLRTLESELDLEVLRLRRQLGGG